MRLLLLLLLAASATAQLDDDARQRFDQAFRLCQQGRFGPGEALYEEVLAMAPEAAEVWLEYTACLRRTGRLARAVRAGWRAVELNPKSHRAWGNLGNALLQAQAWDAAMAVYREAAARTEEHRWALQNFLNVGYQQWIGREYDGAQQTFEYACEQDPSSGLAVLDLACVHASRGEREPATREIERAVTLLEQEGDARALAYARAVQQQVASGEPLDPPEGLMPSHQSLPEAFLTRPADGEALSLEVPSSSRRHFAVPGLGTVSLEVPESWHEEVVPHDGRRLPGLVLRPSTGPARQLHVTPLPSERSVTELEAFVREQGESMLASAVQDELELEEVRSPTVKGYLYFLTDRESIARNPPREGDFPHLLQGALRVGQAECVITVLSLTDDEQLLDEIRDCLHTLEQTPRGG
jgi:tetratricopeptide (TPR) repeat protein